MIEILENELKDTHEPATIIAIRGRLIQTIKKEMKNTKNDVDQELKLQEKLRKYLNDQRIDLDKRYKEDFIKSKAILGSIFTTLPNGLVIAIKRVVNTIEELKQAKNNKQRLFHTIELLKSLGKVTLTIPIYGVKFTVRHWYVLLVCIGILNITDTDTFKTIMKVFNITNENSQILKIIEDVKSLPVVSSIMGATNKTLDFASKLFNK